MLVTKQCEICNKEFITKNKKARFCSGVCMQSWRTSSSWVKCECANIDCKITFEKRKKAPKKYCSAYCFSQSSERRESSRSQMYSKNPMYNQISVVKIQQTKLNRYGNSTFNNPSKSTKTLKERYGEDYKSIKAGPLKTVRISKAQKSLYDYLKSIYVDAIIEYDVPNTNICVDVYIPSTKSIFELYGDYWHCNPEVYEKDYYNRRLHMTAEQKWEADNNRETVLKNLGYSLTIIWEKYLPEYIINENITKKLDIYC